MCRTLHISVSVVKLSDYPGMKTCRKVVGQLSRFRSADSFHKVDHLTLDHWKPCWGGLTHTVRLSFVWWDYPRTLVLVHTFNLDERWQENLDVKSRKNRAFCLFSSFTCSCSFLSVAEPSLFFLHPPLPRQRSLLLSVSSASCFYWLHIYYGNLCRVTWNEM